MRLPATKQLQNLHKLSQRQSNRKPSVRARRQGALRRLCKSKRMDKPMGMHFLSVEMQLLMSRELLYAFGDVGQTRETVDDLKPLCSHRLLRCKKITRAGPAYKQAIQPLLRAPRPPGPPQECLHLYYRCFCLWNCHTQIYCLLSFANIVLKGCNVSFFWTSNRKIVSIF